MDKKHIIPYQEILDPNRPAMLGRPAADSPLQVFGNYQTSYSHDVLQLDERVVEQIAQFAVLSAQNYGAGSLDTPEPEPTLVQNQLGLPAVLVRVDCSLGPDGSVVFYETEDRPSGLGVTRAIYDSALGCGGQFQETILEHYNQQLDGAPHVIIPNERSDTDDIDFYPVGHYHHDPPEQITDATCLPEDATVVVKTCPSDLNHEARYQSLQNRAAAPLCQDGDRTYLARIGQGQLITMEEDQTIYLHSRAGRAKIDNLVEFLGDNDYGVAKGRGSLTEAVVIRKPAQALTKQGTISAGKYPEKVQELLAAKGAVVLQPFQAPFRVQTFETANPNRLTEANGILRIFVLVGRSAMKFSAQVPGGLYCLRRSNVVHGAGDTVFGAAFVLDPEKVYYYDEKGQLNA
jgi:hypothetical protein